MNQPRKNPAAAGFTLIELIIVVAILAFVAMVGLRGYANVRENQARKVNVANIKRIAHSLATYETIHKEHGTSDFFKNFDALIDVAASGGWLGTQGTFDWGTVSGGSVDARTVNGGLGIYDGSWKVLGPLYNAAGEGSGNTATLDEAMDANRGMRDTGLYKSLGIYYLSTNDVTLLRNAGITQILLHNPSTQQAYGSRRNGYCTGITDAGVTVPEGLQSPGGGGPGFRPDMSAFYPVRITNGVPVAVIRPNSTIYNDLGYQCIFTNTTPSATELTDAVSGQKTKLLAFGVGLNAECVKNKIGLGDAPYNPYYDKKNYRQYIAVFALTTRGQGTPSTCHLAGVIDCAGNTARAAEYNSTWTTSLD